MSYADEIHRLAAEERQEEHDHATAFMEGFRAFAEAVRASTVSAAEYAEAMKDPRISAADLSAALADCEVQEANRPFYDPL